MTTLSEGRAPSIRDNLQALRAAQKPARGTAAYGRYVNRPTGRVVAAALHRAGVTPDQATAVSATLSAAGLTVLALAPPAWGPLVAVLLCGGYVMDSVDGQLARLRGSRSVRGEWLDHTVDCFKISSLHLAVVVSWYRFPGGREDEWLLVPLAFAVVQSATYFGLIVMPFLRAAGPDLARRSPGESREHPLRAWLILPTDYGVLLWAFALTPWPSAFTFAYTTLLVLGSVLLALALRKWWGELGQIDAGRVTR